MVIPGGVSGSASRSWRANYGWRCGFVNRSEVMMHTDTLVRQRVAECFTTDMLNFIIAHLSEQMDYILYRK
jgi:hypothetical protein